MRVHLVPRALMLLIAGMLLTSTAGAGPRDASAVLLHCGNATLGDTTIYENHTIAGGRRILKYISGTLNFDRVGNEGWTFTFASHGKKDRLTAAEMDRYMPCLTVALADSASPEPLKPVTTQERIATSMKKPYEKLIGVALLLLLLLTAVYFVFGRRKDSEDD